MISRGSECFETDLSCDPKRITKGGGGLVIYHAVHLRIYYVDMY